MSKRGLSLGISDVGSNEVTLDMARRGLVWLDDSGALWAHEANQVTTSSGITLQDILIACQSMKVVDILSMAARMARTVNVSTAFAASTEDPS
jgi:hypothetical protein